MKKIFNNILSFVIIIVLLLTLSGCSEDNSNLLNEKVKKELSYLDLEIVSLINALNNITIENYKISTQEISLR